MKKLIKWIHKFWTHTYIVTIYKDGRLQWTVKGWVKDIKPKQQ